MDQLASISKWSTWIRQAEWFIHRSISTILTSSHKTAYGPPKAIRNRTVGRHSVRCLAIGGGVSPGWRARRQRDRARHNRFRARIEWRLDWHGGDASA